MHAFTSALLLFAPPATGGPAPNPIIQLVPLVLIFVVFYFFMIRPQQKSRKTAKKCLKV